MSDQQKIVRWSSTELEGYSPRAFGALAVGPRGSIYARIGHADEMRIAAAIAGVSVDEAYRVAADREAPLGRLEAWQDARDAR